MHTMDNKALKIVTDYAFEYLGKTYLANGEYPHVALKVLHGGYTWKGKELQNWKYLLSTDSHDGMFLDLSYSCDKDKWYLDVYKKCESRCIKGTDKFKSLAIAESKVEE